MRKRTESKLMLIEFIFGVIVNIPYPSTLTMSTVSGRLCVGGLIDVIPWDIRTTMNASDLEV